MSKETHSQDFNSEQFKKIWEEMDKIDPLTPGQPSESELCIEAYMKAAEHDSYLFGDYDYCKEWLGICT